MKTIYEFKHDQRLGIELPVLHREWEELSKEQRSQFLHRWEQIRGRIPDRIKALESVIIEKLNRLNEETDFAVCCVLNFNISELASIITDLHLWFRVNQEVSVKNHD